MVYRCLILNLGSLLSNSFGSVVKLLSNHEFVNWTLKFHLVSFTGVAKASHLIFKSETLDLEDC